MSRDEAVGVIRQTTEALGRMPSMNELATTNRLGRYDLRKHFAVYTSAEYKRVLMEFPGGFEGLVSADPKTLLDPAGVALPVLEQMLRKPTLPRQKSRAGSPGCAKKYTRLEQANEP
jgi:hypothetical protein